MIYGFINPRVKDQCINQDYRRTVMYLQISTYFIFPKHLCFRDTDGNVENGKLMINLSPNGVTLIQGFGMVKKRP